MSNANSTALEVTIAEETSLALNDLESQLRRAYAPRTVLNVLQRATLDGAKALRPAVSASLPAGRMQKAVRAKASQFIKPASYVGISLGKSRKDPRGAYWAFIFVKGAKPHVIRAWQHEIKNRAKETSKRGNFARMAIAGGQVGAASRALKTKNGLFAAVHHPGSKGAGPVVERAVQANLRTGIDAMTASIVNFLVNKTFGR